ncbi:hypothetical protein [Loigolactobacillus backii]|uniref:Uncharacterized protein n=1 Tax=Loigolactobacillus backii TaxID=375175 RepID=A0A192H177_9LACO|nr:hypothetical protein [Loigolactobacillus backii]ANK60730.1 hypothetical protein AYR52_11000 [Loigolactobacillus backii]ANK61701.1 hypothetical protein AYR53_02325 [Loigolactobacillus backii]ANK65683.1 hypothetical protein AYR54_10800 [Loigolactobacillus backii]ANK68160.1 hypothetical protein AYR55_10955 [Loigolactobacillus backii]ANK69102.1 hypothetical protein AYR56_02390 [Loigolactobacillus backii]
MFEPTKKHRTAKEVAELLPKEVINLIWNTLSDFRKQKKLVQSPLAVAFSDDFDATTIYILILQNNAGLAEEVKLDYSGNKDFLGKGTILIVSDKAKTISMTISEANKQNKKTK